MIIFILQRSPFGSNPELWGLPPRRLPSAVPISTPSPILHLLLVVRSILPLIGIYFFFVHLWYVLVTEFGGFWFFGGPYFLGECKCELLSKWVYVEVAMEE
ncbi:hypothetical protein RDI58_015783 [Solanum bulbocastanum]|uniref:Uncharacterized protein n=1 Tax=Solanum bulbocastanum TaxID=147425 RepID=A0AAN8YFB2_SOLBU